MATGEEKTELLKQAIADYLEIPVEEVGNFFFGCDRQTAGGDVLFSGGWTPIAHWYLIGMVDELRVMLEKNRNPQGQTAVPQLQLPPELAEMFKKGVG